MTREALRAAGEAEIARWEKAIADELLRLFDRQEAVVLARLRGTKAKKHTRHWDPAPTDPRPFEVKAIIDPARWVKDAAASLLPLVERLFAAVYRRVATQLDPDGESAPAADDDRIRQAVQDRLGRIADGVAGALGEVESYVQREEDAGSTIPAMADGVQQVYAARKDSWATRLATLSTVGSINHAAMLAAMDKGSTAKQWLSQRDQSVRPSHVHADGQVRLLDERFRLGGGTTGIPRSLLMFPGDPSPSVPIGEVINCRCLLLFSPPRKGTKSLPTFDPADELAWLLEGKADDSHTPPPAVRAAAKRGLALRAEHGRGGTEVGVARARDLAGGGGVSSDTVRRMASYFARHAVDKDGEGWGKDSAGYIAWLLWGGDAGAAWARDVVRSLDAKDADLDLEAKARVRTAGGAAQYGQPIGSVIVPNPVGVPHTGGHSGSRAAAGSRTHSQPLPAAQPGPVVGKIGDNRVDDASADPVVRALVAKYSTPGAVPEEAKTTVLAMRDRRGRVGGYVVWQKTDGDQPAGTVLAVSVHPALRGQRVGDQLVALAMTEDPRIKPTTRPATRAAAPGPAARATLTPPPARAGGTTWKPAVRDRTQPGDAAGTSGDFVADSARIDRLQNAYLRDGADTRTLFSRGGRWTRDRERAQQEIIDHFLNQRGVKADRKLLLVGGLPGAGKTTTINSPAGQQAVGINLDEYVVVNADEVKAEMLARGMVPDYPGLSDEESATLFHAESFEVAHSLMRQAAKRGLNFSYDTSLKTTGQAGFPAQAAAAAGQKYETTMLFVDVPLPVAKQRARDRYLAGERYMPLALIDGMRARTARRASGPAENFDVVKKQADRWVVFDNAGTTPVVLAQGGGRRVRP